MLKRRTLLASALASPALAPIGLAQESWPSRAITMVCPFVPGGLPDSNARFMAQQLAPRLGQPVVVENKGGAGGNIGTEFAARARPDGYTMLFGTMGTHGSNPALYRLPFDPLADFIPVHALFADMNIAVVGANSRFTTLADVVLVARANPGRLTYGSGGIGSGVHLAGALFAKVAGIELTHVPYRGTPAALADVAAGRLDLIFDYAVTSGPLIEAGRLRPLAVTGGRRMTQLPQVPSMKEAGFPEAELGVWSGLFLPTGTPVEIARRLAVECEAILASETAAAWAARTDSDRMQGLFLDRFRAFVAAEQIRWRGIVEASGAKVE